MFRVGVIGGSIAGCSAAILLKRLGAEVVILERSEISLQERGAGIVLPETFVKQCIDLDLFDSSIPRLFVNKRIFLVKDSQYINYGKEIWQQNFSVVTLNWRDVFQNLRKRVSNKDYYSGVEVSGVKQENGVCIIEAKNNQKYYFDRIIVADGITSVLRKQFFPESSLSYTGYIAWRGVVKSTSLIESGLMDKQVFYYGVPQGHFLIYGIPDIDFQEHGTVLLNWLFYETCSPFSLKELLFDKNGLAHEVSLPPGSLTECHLNHLHTLVKNHLPIKAANIVYATKQPFIQPIFDLQISCYVKNTACFIGDSATLLRPHSASGVFKALTDSISLAEIFAESAANNMQQSLVRWDINQTKIASEQSTLAKSMGEALVTHAPDWRWMSHQKMEKWWESVMQNKNWYATKI